METDIKPAEHGEPNKVFLYEKIADELEYDIISNSYPGNKLPSEQNLATRYGASRAVIREALKILSERGLVSTMVGSGAFITKPDINELSVVVNRLINTHEIDYSDAFDVRIILETASASRAAQHITEEELAEMEKVVESLRSLSTDIEERNKADFKFHMMIANASHNQLLAILIGAISNIIYDIIKFAVAGGHEEEGGPNGLINHAKIYWALKDHDATAAEHMMYDHLYNAKKFYTKYVSEHRPDILLKFRPED